MNYHKKDIAVVCENAFYFKNHVDKFGDKSKNNYHIVTCVEHLYGRKFDSIEIALGEKNLDDLTEYAQFRLK